jgi:hypothetical protein
MTGHHEVRRWKAPSIGQIMTLPENWKPFAVVLLPTGEINVVCRKWVRDIETPKTTKEPST